MKVAQRLTHALLLMVPLFHHPYAHAQTYPRKPVAMIVPNAPGGAFDAAARPLAQAMGQALGQPVVIDNRPAGQGIIGVQAAARSAPDGYTVLFTGSSNISFLPLLRANLPYDAQRDLAPIVRLGFLDSFVIVHPTVPAASFKELLELARAKPDTITWGSWGSTSNSNIYIEWLKRARNVSFYTVPYKTAPQALNAVIAGEVQVMVFGQGQLVPLIKAGKLRALAATGTQRSPFMPDIPTMKETGTGFDLQTPLWVGLFAPAGTPREIVARLNSVGAALLADRGYTDKALVSLGYLPDVPHTPEQFAEAIRQDRLIYSDLIKVTGIKDDN
jgi:tripartite-type tricarboxylate transporter receptor subunit TctC